MPKHILGVDVGGTKIQAGLVNNKNQIIKTKQFPTNAKNRDIAIKNIAAAIQYFYSKNVKAIGIGITGFALPKTGIVAGSPNLPKSWHNVPLKKIIAKKFKVPVAIDNDGSCVALAEAIKGEGKNYNIVYSLTLGTGVGAGLVINKKLYHGAQGVTEYGHTIIADRSPRCSCGLYGHLEALASGLAMEKIYFQYTGKKMNPFQIEERAKNRNRAAMKTIATMSHYLSVGLANIIHTFNPKIIIIGGGLSKVDILVKPAIKSVNNKLIYPGLKNTTIVTSRLGYKAGVIGAALITK
ncbi:ROK family protein [Patescibacteria group bacterium]|nr:ROK family protein [Patescibacteria group bacterium]MBU0964473.1 ROK family protein [Patescibacteria group bacterium]